jgi:hypothetical protein
MPISELAGTANALLDPRPVTTRRGCRLKLSACQLVIALALFFVTGAASARAQTPPMPDTDLSLGYQSLHIPGQNYPLGVFVGVSTRMTDMVRIVGEAGLSIDQQSGSNLNGTLTLYQYGIGPRLTAGNGRVIPFAQVLVGGVHSRGDLTTPGGAPFSASSNGFMIQPGGGIIVPVTRTFAFSAGFNYRRVMFENDSDNETSLFAAVRIAFR